MGWDGDGIAQAAQHVFQWQQRLLPKSQDNGFRGRCQHRALGRLGPHRRIGASAVVVRSRHLATAFGGRPERAARDRVLMRAAALRHIDLTSFVTQSALREAEAVIAEADVIKVSERDFARVHQLLDSPPQPNAKLRAAAAALPKSL